MYASVWLCCMLLSYVTFEPPEGGSESGATGSAAFCGVAAAAAAGSRDGGACTGG